MIQGRIVIDSERCKGCELCTTVCPQHVIHMSGVFNSKGYQPAELADPTGACTGCAVCAIICPDTAITVFRRQEPRTKNREPAGVVVGAQRSTLAAVERRLP